MSNYCQTANVGIPSPYQGTQIVTTNGGNARGIAYARRYKSTFKGLGWTEVALGITLVIIGITAYPVCAKSSCVFSVYFWFWTMLGTGIWGGALVILFGAFEIVQAHKPTRCTITTNLTMSILGIVLTPVLLGLEITAAYWSYINVTLFVLHSIASIICFVLFILFIISSSYAGQANGCCLGCGAACCCDPRQQEVVSFIQGSVHPQVFTMANGHTVILQGHTPSAQYAETPPPEYAMANLNLPGYTSATSQLTTLTTGVTNEAWVGDALPKVGL